MEESESDSEFSVFDDARPPEPRPKRSRRCLSIAGTFIAWIVLDPTLRAPSELESVCARHVDAPPNFSNGDPSTILGIAIVGYVARKATDAVTDGHIASMHSFASSERRHTIPIGFIDYHANTMFVMDGRLPHVELAHLNRPRIRSTQWANEFANSTFGGQPMYDVCESSSSRAPSHIIRVGPCLGELLVKNLTNVVKSVAISSKPRYAQLISDHPPKQAVKQWVKNNCSGDDVGDEPDADRVPFDLTLPSGWEYSPKVQRGGPVQMRQEFDPLVVFNAFKFSRHLKDLRQTHEALDDAIECKVGDEELAANIKEKGTQNPHRSSILRSRMKVDATSMCLERRRFQYFFDHPDEVESMHVWSDASPVPGGGSEVQGMVLQIMLASSEVLTTILPGVVLFYERYRLIDKVFALLWTLYLVVGPRLAMLRFVCNSIRTFTTDLGTEMNMSSIPDILPAFVAWLNGTSLDDLVDTVDHASRLFPNSATIGGWGHMFGNLMKHAANVVQTWPDIIWNLRQLVTFLRNDSWRKVIIKRLAPITPEVRTLLKSFTCTFAKWRYETLFVCVRDLLNVAGIREHLVNISEWFSEFKDPKLLSTVQQAFASTELWLFMRVFFDNVLEPLEHGRRWGLTCACCAQVGRARASCARASRRLREAPAFISNLVRSLIRSAENLTWHACGEVQWIFDAVQFSLRSSAAELKTKGDWVSRVPYNVSNADTPEGLQ